MPGAGTTAVRAAISEPPAQTAADQVPASKGAGRKKVVVLGSGWGAVSFVKSLPADTPYDVVLVSPRNYFLYTPLLPGAATGATGAAEGSGGDAAARGAGRGRRRGASRRGTR